MKQTVLLLSSIVLFWGCTTTPEEHRDLAFRKYSLECVARGIQENTQAHTDCVVQKYKTFTQQQERGEAQMREIFAEEATSNEGSVSNN